MVKNMHMLGVAKDHKSLSTFVEKEGCSHKNYSFSIVKDNDKQKSKACG
jgi:Fe-S cluster assembly iron-binding protein IscA